MAGEESRGELGAARVLLWATAGAALWFGLDATGLVWWLRLAVAAAVVLALALATPRVEQARRRRREQRGGR